MTTSLYTGLAGYSESFKLGTRKELNYFRRSDVSRRDYTNLFKNGNKGITLEASPFYIFDVDSLQKINETLGDSLRLVLIRRDPVERAISHYFHSVIRGYETRGLREAMEGDLRKFSEYDSEAERIHHSYLNRSNFDFLEAQAINILGDRVTIFDSQKNTLRAIIRSVVEKTVGLDKRSISVFPNPVSDQLKTKNSSYAVVGRKRFKFLTHIGLQGQDLLKAGILTRALRPGKENVSESDRVFIKEGLAFVKRLNSPNPPL